MSNFKSAAQRFAEQNESQIVACAKRYVTAGQNILPTRILRDMGANTDGRMTEAVRTVLQKQGFASHMAPKKGRSQPPLVVVPVVPTADPVRSPVMQSQPDTAIASAIQSLETALLASVPSAVGVQVASLTRNHNGHWVAAVEYDLGVPVSLCLPSLAAIQSKWEDFAGKIGMRLGMVVVGYPPQSIDNTGRITCVVPEAFDKLAEEFDLPENQARVASAARAVWGFPLDIRAVIGCPK